MINNKYFFASLIIASFAFPSFSQASIFTESKKSQVDNNLIFSKTSQKYRNIEQNHQINFISSLPSENGNVESFSPACREIDQLCSVWSEFRTPHPYPTQKISIKFISDNEMVLIISEPSKELSKRQWKNFIESIFSTDLIEYRTFKWSIGVDGWLEDIVLKINSTNIPQKNILSHKLTRDRVALLKIAMFGSSVEASIEHIESSTSEKNITKVPNLNLSASEIFNWITDRKMGWKTPNFPSQAVNHWMDQNSVGIRQVLTSADQTLILLTFPKADILTTRRTGSLPVELRNIFRKFAVNSDIIIGGAWSADQIAILARARQIPIRDFPPLRVETFEIIANQESIELHQSYERGNLFAGKLTTGKYANRDWAPIYLSPVLLNTEFGALLNITDQMLKSWSEAGQIEYIYFDYPGKPNNFPFSGIPLTKLVFEPTGSQEVLFNWNTTGMGSIIYGSPSVLVPMQTGALPITYGSDFNQKGKIQTGHLQRYEEEAYNYFANLQDPKLSTVVQYTLLYQIMLAAAPIKGGPLAVQPTKTSQALSTYALNFINNLEATNDDNLRYPKKLISDFRKEFPDINDLELATLLVNPRGDKTKYKSKSNQTSISLSSITSILEKRIHRYNSLLTESRSKQDSYNNDVKKFIDEVDRLNYKGEITPSERSNILKWQASIKANKRKLDILDNDLQKRLVEIENLKKKRKKLDTLRLQLNKKFNVFIDKVQQLVVGLKESTDLGGELDQIRVAFNSEHPTSSNSWIKTPASVLSWRNKGGIISLSSTGGHNLNSKALRFEESSLITNLQVIKTASGRVLQYPANQREDVLANATSLARAVEHKKIINSQALSQIGKRPVENRSRREALKLGRTIKNDRPGDAELLGELRYVAEMNDCCIFVADSDEGLAYLAIKNSSPPPGVSITQFGDTPSLYSALAEQSKSLKSTKPIILLDGFGRADAMARSLISEINRQPNAAPKLIDRLKSLTQIITRSPSKTESQVNSVTVLGYGQNQQLHSLRINLEAGGNLRSKVIAVESLLTPIDLNNEGVQEIISSEIKLQLPSRWKKSADLGKLAIIKFSYTEKGSLGKSNNVYVSSVADQTDQVPMLRTEMADATNRVIEANMGQDTMALDTLIEIRDQIGEQLESFPNETSVEMILEKGQDIYFITNKIKKINSRNGS